MSFSAQIVLRTNKNPLGKVSLDYPQKHVLVPKLGRILTEVVFLYVCNIHAPVFLRDKSRTS